MSLTETSLFEKIQKTHYVNAPCWRCNTCSAGKEYISS